MMKFGPEVDLIETILQKRFFCARVCGSWIFNEMRRFKYLFIIAYKKNLPSNHGKWNSFLESFICELIIFEKKSRDILLWRPKIRIKKF